MNQQLKNIWRDMIDKRLWPVAAVLVLMIVAVPMVLGKPGPAPVATAPAVPAPIDHGPELALESSTTTGFIKAPRVSTASIDPFGARKSKKVAFVKTSTGKLAVVSTGGTPSGGASSGPTPVPQTQTPKPATPKVTKTESDDVISVLLGLEGTSPQTLSDLRTLTPLPDADNPFLVFEGVTSEGNASFLVSADVTATGDGTCSPSPAECDTLTMKEGDTETFTLTTNSDQKYDMSLTSIGKKNFPVTGAGSRVHSARLTAKARAIGARAVTHALRNPSVANELFKSGVRFH